MQKPVDRFRRPKAPNRMTPSRIKLAIPRMGPRKEKSFPVKNTVAVRTPKTPSVATAATRIGLNVWPPIGVTYKFPIQSSGHRITENAKTYVSNPAYCLPIDASERAQDWVLRSSAVASIARAPKRAYGVLA